MSLANGFLEKATNEWCGLIYVNLSNFVLEDLKIVLRDHYKIPHLTEESVGEMVKQIHRRLVDQYWYDMSYRLLVLWIYQLAIHDNHEFPPISIEVINMEGNFWSEIERIEDNLEALESEYLSNLKEKAKRTAFSPGFLPNRPGLIPAKWILGSYVYQKFLANKHLIHLSQSAVA